MPIPGRKNASSGAAGSKTQRGSHLAAPLLLHPSTFLHPAGRQLVRLIAHNELVDKRIQVAFQLTLIR
jgi:hypothetical protein